MHVTAIHMTAFDRLSRLWELVAVKLRRALGVVVPDGQTTRPSVPNKDTLEVMTATVATRPIESHGRRGSNPRYAPPSDVTKIAFGYLLEDLSLPRLESKQLSLIAGGAKTTSDFPIWYSGDIDILKRPAVSVVGAREVTADGAARARRIARQLAEGGVTIVSGLAAGVDTHALNSAIAAGGKVAAVIGTPITQAYPAENARLQEMIYRDHLLVSQFSEGSRVFRTNFPARNRLMASLSLGTVIIEASDSSGTLHQAAECTRLNRWLFVLRSVVDDNSLTWPKRFKSTYERFIVVDSVDDVLRRVLPGCS